MGGSVEGGPLTLVPHVVNGLALGLLFALIALGFMLIVSVMETINLAHGSFFALGMYVALVIVAPAGSGEFLIGYRALPIGWRYAIAMLVAPIVVGVFGMLLELALRRTYGRDALYGLLLTFGAALVIEEAIRAVFGSTEKQLALPEAISGAFMAGDIIYAKYRVFACVLAGRASVSSGCSSRRRRTDPSSRRARTTARWCARSASTSRACGSCLRARCRARRACRRRHVADLGHAPARGRRCGRACVPHHRAGRRRQLLGRGHRRAHGRPRRRLERRVRVEWSLLSMYLLFIAIVTFRARGLFGRKSILDV
jgi:hypothetical protein